jgi:hypothetical protein
MNTNMTMNPNNMHPTMSPFLLSRRALGRGLVGGLLAAATATARVAAPSDIQ